MEIVISGIVCDACDYRCDNVQFAEYRKWVNKPCPKCGANLLTEKDYKKCTSIIKKVELANKIGKVLRWINPFFYWRLLFGDKRLRSSVTIYKK